MHVTVRKMCPEELASALELLDQYNMAPRSDLVDAERSGFDIENSFVAVADGRVVGVASYIIHSPHFAETASLAVHRDCLGMGVGYSLQQARLAEMRSRGIRKVRTEADRPETIRWYIEKFGYTEAGTNPKKHDFSLSDVDHWTVLELRFED